MTSEGQQYVVSIPGSLARRARAVVEGSGQAYEDLNELIVVALENQLRIEASSSPAPAGAEPTSDATQSTDYGLADLAGEPVARVSLDGVELDTVPPRGTGARLFVLTNRLSPVALGCRILLGLTVRDGPPGLEHFLDEASRAARKLGLILRSQDQDSSVSAADRRSVAWPVGDDEAKSVERFRWAFLLHPEGAADPGAMEELGLAVTRGRKALLTDRGVALGAAASPLLGEVEDGWTLGPDQQKVLKDQLLSMPEERTEIAMVLSAVAGRDNGIAQEELDRHIAAAHDSWSRNQRVAHRAAMLGRLRELDILEVTGRGSAAIVKTKEGAEAFIQSALHKQQEKLP